MTNLLAYGGKVWLLTVTAPGADVLPWSEDGRRVVQEEAADEWNRTAPGRWSELHRQASQATKRDGHSLSFLTREWQLQGRGVLHVHVVVGVETWAEKAAANVYVGHLRRLARQHGFGFIDAVDRDGKSGKSRVMEAHRAAGYLTKYLAESSQLMRAVEMRHRPGNLLWVSPRLSALTLCTRRRLRRARLLWRIRTGTSSIFAAAGHLPVWFADARELAAVHGLLRGSVAPAAP